MAENAGKTEKCKKCKQPLQYSSTKPEGYCWCDYKSQLKGFDRNKTKLIVHNTSSENEITNPAEIPTMEKKSTPRPGSRENDDNGSHDFTTIDEMRNETQRDESQEGNYENGERPQQKEDHHGMIQTEENPHYKPIRSHRQTPYPGLGLMASPLITPIIKPREDNNTVVISYLKRHEEKLEKIKEDNIRKEEDWGRELERHKEEQRNNLEFRHRLIELLQAQGRMLEDQTRDKVAQQQQQNHS